MAKGSSPAFSATILSLVYINVVLNNKTISPAQCRRILNLAPEYPLILAKLIFHFSPKGCEC